MAASKPNRISDTESQKEDDSEAVQIYEPEPEKEELLMGRCQCANCQHYTNAIGWCTSPSIQCERRPDQAQREKIVHPILKSSQYPGKKAKIKSYTDRILSESEKESAFKTLVHGVIIPTPVHKCENVYFHEDVHMALRDLRYTHTKPIQSFVWPAIFAGMNVFMIGGPKSGKTMAYLPAICTYAFHSDQYKKFDKYKGPLAVIVCPNSNQCEEIYDLIKKLYKKLPYKPKVTNMTYPIINTNSMDLLITIPDVLVHCLKSRMFHLKRLCHLVFENTSMLLKNNEESINTILKVANEMLEHRANEIQLKLIVSSEKWTTDMLKFLKSLYLTPLVCIEDYLEAALYGGIKFEIKFLVSEVKQSFVEELLKNKYRLYKTLIICNDDEITELNKYLVRNGIETLALRDESSKEDIELTNYEWSSASNGMYKVLLATDYILGAHTSIIDAVWVIHYSFAKSWARFCEIFRTQSLNYKSPLTDDKNAQCRSYVLIDETCKRFMPKIINLLRRLSKDFPKSYQEYAKSCNLEMEQAKIASKTELCKTLKLFGRCPDSFCKERHLLTEDLDTSSDFPKNGKIVFKIVDLKDVTNYSVQLLRHIDLDGRVTIINDDNLKQPLQYEHKLKKQADPQDIKPGDFYIERKHTTGSSEFKFCQVLTVVCDTFVEIKLLNGVVAQVLKTNLFELPEDLKIAEIYMSNLIPPYKDEYFSGRSYYVTRTSLESKEYKDIVLTADIQLQLNNTFWIANVAEIAKSGDVSLVKFNFTKNLKDLQVVDVSKTQLADLYKLCSTCGISLPVYDKAPVKKAVKTKELEPQRAFLNEEPNEVFLISAINPGEFYVVLRKFHDLLKNLEEDIQKAVRTEILDKDVKVVIGKHYLALDPRGKTYSRALILNIQDDKALIFYVDYGDEAVVDVSSLKNLPSKFITRLPFQAIQCRLHGLFPAFGEWDDEATDILYKYMFEPDSDIYRSLFVQVCEKEESSSIRSKYMHSVLLKDGFGDKNCLINQLIIDCGFATSISGKFDDFELPQCKETSNSAESDSEISGNEDEAVDDEILEFSEDDLEIMDGPKFLEVTTRAARSSFIVSDIKVDGVTIYHNVMFFPSNLRNNVQNQIKQITYESKERERENDENPVQAEVQPSTSIIAGAIEEPSGKLTPEVYWSQTDNIIRLRIKIAGVTEYKTNLVHRKIFMFWTKLDEKIYELKFTLHQLAEMSKHCAKGQEVEVVLKKVQPLEWTQLTNTSKRSRNVHYEFPDHEKPKPRRKILQLDIEDPESEPEEMYHESSDMDSDFDPDAVSSPED